VMIQEVVTDVLLIVIIMEFVEAEHVLVPLDGQDHVVIFQPLVLIFVQLEDASMEFVEVEYVLVPLDGQELVVINKILHVVEELCQLREVVMDTERAQDKINVPVILNMKENAVKRKVHGLVVEAK